MSENINKIYEITTQLQQVDSRMDLLERENRLLKGKDETFGNTITIVESRLDNQKSSIDNLTEQFRNIDGHIELEIDHDQFATKDFLKEELLTYQKKTIDYIDDIREGGFDEELRDSIRGVNTKIEIENGRISSTITKVERMEGLVRVLSTQIEQTAEYIKSIATDYTLDTIQQQLTLLESFRIQTASRLEDTVTRIDMDLLKNQVTKHESSIVQLADSITSTVSKKEFEGLEIGSRNMLRHSLVMNGNYRIYGSAGSLQFRGDEKRPYARLSTTSDGTLGLQSTYGVDLKRGQKYTVSFDFRSQTVERLNYSYMIDVAGNFSLRYNTILDTDGNWSRYAITFENDIEARDDSRILLGIDLRSMPVTGYFDIRDIKIEEGDKPTTWNAAPEDMDDFLDEYQKQVDGEFQDVHNGALGLNETLTSAFRDGVVTEAEANAIMQDRQQVIKEKEDIDAIFNNLYTNVYLFNPEKSNLNVKYNLYHQKHNILMTSIVNVIRDGKVNKEEVAMIDTNFIEYNKSVAEVREAISVAMIAISDGYTADEIDKISIGGTNLVSEANINFSSATTGTKNRYVKDGILTLKTDNQYGGIHFKLDSIEPRQEYIMHYYYYKNSGSGPVNLWGGLIGGSADTSFTSFTYYYDGVEQSGHSFTADNDSGLHHITVKMKTSATVNPDVLLYIQPNRGNVGHNTMTNVTIADLKVEKGNKSTAWSPSPYDIDFRFTEHESRIHQTEEEIELRVTELVYNQHGKLVSEALSAIELIADGISLTSSKDGLISGVNITPSQVKINTARFEINDGDVIVKDGKTTIKEAFITKLTAMDISADRIKTGNWKLAVGSKIEGVSGSLVLQGDTLLTTDRYDSKKYVRIDPSGLTITKGSINIQRPDGAWWTQNGMLAYDFAVVSSTPSFTSSNLYPASNPSFFASRTSSYSRIDYFTFKHATRYLKVVFSPSAPTTGSQCKMRITKAGTHSGEPDDVEVLWSANSSYRQRDGYGKVTATIDLGIPDFQSYGIYAQFATSVAGTEVWCKIDTIYKEDIF